MCQDRYFLHISNHQVGTLSEKLKLLINQQGTLVVVTSNVSLRSGHTYNRIP